MYVVVVYMILLNACDVFWGCIPPVVCLFVCPRCTCGGESDVEREKFVLSYGAVVLRRVLKFSSGDRSFFFFPAPCKLTGVGFFTRLFCAAADQLSI